VRQMKQHVAVDGPLPTSLQALAHS
jgi:hypothetical protein